MKDNAYTKESIKSRMFSRMAKLWNIRNVDGLDPLVKLMVESLASEIFKLAGEMEDAEDRIVEKLARTFTPSFMMAASAAHGVIHARAVSGIAEIDIQTEFLYKAPHFLQRYNLPKLTFTPVRNMKIWDADVAAIISREKFYRVSPDGGKDHVANAIGRDPAFNNAVWVGLETGREVRSLKDVSFYFEMPLMDNAADYFKLLGYAKMSCNGKDIDVTQGMPMVDPDADKSLFGLYDPCRHMYEDITDKYECHYLSVAADVDVREINKEKIPVELNGLFADEFTYGLGELLWIKVSLPPAFDDNALAHLCVHINCIPVANIFSRATTHTITPVSTIIPLEKDEREYFLYVDSVTDAYNKEYRQVRSHDDNTAAGTYMIRRGGSEKFNSINAKDYLEKLLDLYRDESTAFSNIDSDIAGTAEGLLSHLNELNVKLQSYDKNMEYTSYLILSNAINSKQNLTVQYSLSNGPIANGIKPYELFSIPEVSDIEPSSAILMSATRGGRKSPSESSQKDMYQYLLTSRDRIYTNEDIRLFCKCYYGEYLSNVSVERGYDVSKVPQEGIIRTTNIIIEGAGDKRGEMEPEILVKDMLAGLRRRSPEGMNYRIILK